MPDSQHYRKLERMYHDAPMHDIYDPTLTVGEGRATLELPVSERYHHPAGAVHGTAYFKALDDAAFFAVNSLVEDVFVLTTQFNLHLTRPISEGTMIAEGEVVHDRPSQYIAEATVRDEEGRQLGRASGLFQRSEIELTPEIGYE